MSLKVSPQTESRITAEARRLGVSVDALLDRFINEYSASIELGRKVRELPTWHLGVIGSLHRRDIYNDVP